MEYTALKRFIVRGIEILASAVFLIPLFVTPQTMYPYVLPKVLVFQGTIEIAAVLWLVLAAIDRTYWSIFKHPITVSLFAFFAVSAIASFFGVDPLRSFFSTHERMTGVILMGHLFVWYVILASVFRAHVQWNRLLWTTLIVSFFMGLFSIDFTVIGEVLFQAKKWQPLSPLGNPIYLGVYAMIHVFLSLVLYCVSGNKKQKWIALFFAIWNACILYLSASRGPLVAFVIGVFICAACALCICRSKVLTKKLASIAIALIALTAVLAGVSAGLQLRLPYIVEKLTTEAKGSFDYRSKLWGFGIDAFKERPILGWGWENFYYYYNRHYKEPGYGTDFTDTWVDKTHNQLIDILSGTGMAGMAAYAFVWIIVIGYLARILLKPALPMNIKICACIVLGALAAYFVQNLSIFDSPATLILLYVLLSYSYFLVSTDASYAVTARVSRQRQNTWKHIVLLGALSVLPIASALLIYTINIKPFTESAHVVEGLGSMRAEPEKTLALFQEILAQPSLISMESRLQLSGEIVNTLLPTNAPENVKKGIVTFALDELEKSIKAHPSDVKNIYAYAMLSRINHTLGETDLSRAKELMRRVEKLAPYRSETLRESFELYSMTGDVKEATKWAELYGKNFNRAESHYLLGMMHLRNNDFTHALQEFLEGDRGGYNAFQNQFIFRFIGYNILSKEVTKEYLAFVDRGVEYYPDNADLLAARIIMHYKAGDREAAKRYLSELNVRNAPLATEVEGYLESLK